MERSYVRAYFTPVGTRAVCKLCGLDYAFKKDYRNVRRHLQKAHGYTDHKVKCYSIIEDNQQRTKCGLCPQSYGIYRPSINMKNHLTKIHKIDAETAQKHQNWLSCSNHAILNSDETMTCKYCNQNFHNYINLMLHLIEAYQIRVPFAVRPSISESSSKPLNADRNAEDIATSNSDQQPISDDDSDCEIDVCN